MGLIVVGNGVGENGCKYTIESKPQNIYGSNYKPSFGATSGSSTDPTSDLTSGSGMSGTSSGAFNSINEEFIINFTFDSPYETNSKPDDLFIYHQSQTKMTFSEAFHYCARQGLR